MKKEYKGHNSNPVIGIRVISARIARKTGISREDTRKVLNAFVEVVGEAIRSGAFIIIKGLFSCRIGQRKARNTFVPKRNGPGHYTTTPARSYIRMHPCVPLIKGVPLGRGKRPPYVKKEE